MTRPGPPPPRGRHAAPDDDPRPDDGAPGGRHAAPDRPRRHAAQEREGYSDPSPRRRHAAPEDFRYGVADDSPTGVTYHRPTLGNSLRYPRPAEPPAAEPGQYDPDPGSMGYGTPSTTEAGSYAREPSPDRYESPDASGTGSYGPRPDPDGYPTFGANRAGTYGPEPSGNGRAGRANTAGHHRPAPTPDGYMSGRGGDGQHRSESSPSGYAADEVGYRRGTGDEEYGGAGGVGYRRAEPGAERYQAPADDAIGYHRPSANGAWYRSTEPDSGEFGADGVAYHRPGAHRYDGGEVAPHPWPEANGYHLDTPAAPAVNGYRLDEPVAPVTGFPYTAPPSAPIAYPVNGHGVDAAERDAASWPVNGDATAWPIDGHRTQLDRPLDPQIAVVPLHDEPTEVLDRPALKPPAGPQPAAVRWPAAVEQAAAGKQAPAGKEPTPPHPPRAVVRRRRARRKALEWPFLIVFAVVSAFLIRQYVVQTFYIPSASMHETLIEGDRVLVNKVGYHLHDIHRGDVVVFRKPPNLNVSEDDLIKRVVGLPGETVEGRGGKVYVNGAPLDEPYVEALCHGTGDFAKVTVPAGSLWVMGDNRCNSSDSRVFGPISEHLVVGRAFVIAWPFDRLSWL